MYLTITPDIFLNQTYLVRLGIFQLELGKKHTFWLWEWGRISAPNFGDREPCGTKLPGTHCPRVVAGLGLVSLAQIYGQIKSLCGKSIIML